MKDPTIAVLTPGRRGGRPRVEEPRATVSTWLPAREHDELIRQAHARGVSVSAHVRGILVRSVSKPAAR